MNSARSAHEISGLPHCLVDGFKHRMPDIPYEERCYILTHYHSDHYGGLASYWKHARIYCSETTANLITNVLQVNPNIVTRIRIGDSITIKGARVVFMDANHCPGAVILLFQLDNGTNHLHTGDMRYCPAMKLYPALQSPKIDKIYLDTTYAHPKHTFMTQEESITKIVTLATEFLSEHPEDGIVYMSAYNLGKERVIFALADALKVPIYMDGDKIHIMNQIPGGFERVQAGIFTTNPRLGRVHICHMGFLGTLFPYFKPNFDGIRQHMDDVNRYEEEGDGVRHYKHTAHRPMPLIQYKSEEATTDTQPTVSVVSDCEKNIRTTSSTATAYNGSAVKSEASATNPGDGQPLPSPPGSSTQHRSVEDGGKRPTPVRAAIAFIPTGWADNGNFNKTHQLMSDGAVTVCTVPYSEHSNCPELVEFVRFLKPREVVPTVYSDVSCVTCSLQLSVYAGWYDLRHFNITSSSARPH
jgi:hypothetical protein